jgi:uncharacterized protein YjdB
LYFFAVRKDMKKVTLLLLALVSCSLSEALAQQQQPVNVSVAFPQIEFMPLNGYCRFEPVVDPIDFFDIVNCKWVSNNGRISISPDGLAYANATTGEGSISLIVMNDNGVDNIITRKVTVINPFDLTNPGDSLLVLSMGDVFKLEVSSDGALPQNSIRWTVEQGNAVLLTDSIGPQCTFVADTFGVALVSAFIPSSPNVKVSSVVYVADSVSIHRLYVPLGKTRKIDPEELGLASLDDSPDFSLVWYNAYPHIASLEHDLLHGKKVGTDTLTATLSSVHSHIEIKVIVYVVDFKFQPAGVRFMGKNSRDSFAISFSPDPEQLFDARICWTMSPNTQSQQVAYFYQKEEDLDTTTWKKIDVISKQTAGDVYLIAGLLAADNIKDTCLIVVGDLAIGPKSGGLPIVGVGEVLEMTLFPSVGNIAALPDVRWQVDPEYQDVASVDDQGRVTGIKEGFAIVTAIAKNNATWRGSVSVQVSDLTIEYVGSNILRPEGQGQQGDSLYLSLRGISPHLVGWTSSSPDILTVDDNGVVKAKDKTGYALITASLKHQSDVTRTLAVYVSRILFNKPGQLSLTPNSSLELMATLEPNVLNSALRWISTDTEVAVVDQQGRVNTSGKTGYATIMAILPENEAIRAACQLKVWIPVQTVTVTSTHTGTFERGRGYQFSASYAPGNATDPLIRWTSSDPSVASIDKLGWMTPIATGYTRIRATDDHSGISHFYDVSVVEPHLGLLLSSASLSLREEDSYQLQAICLPEGTFLGNIQWQSSDNDIVTVTEETGIVHALKHGEAFITATAGEHSAVCRVIVRRVLNSISLSHDTITLDRNTTQRFPLTLSFVPESSRDFYHVEWTTLDEDIASVSNGQVTPHKEGQTKIIARVENFEIECLVNVIVPLKKIALNHDSIVIQTGEVAQLITFVEPVDVTASQRQFRWSSANENIATVSATGAVEGMKGGTTVVTATTLDGKFSDSCRVIVEIPAEDILLHQHTLSLNRGSKQWMIHSTVPENATFHNTPTWTSSNTSVATVNEQGIVTAIGSGRAVIVATTQGYNTFSDSCIVTVDNPITDLSLPNHVILEQGAEYTLYPGTFPDDATPQHLDWQADNRQVATVSNGLVKAVYKGTTLVRASTEEGKKAETMVIVNIYAGGILLNGVTSIRPGFDFTIAARLFPTDVSEQRVNWNFSTTDGIVGDLVDLVDSGNLYCTLHSKKKGKITIHATSADGRASQTRTVNILSSLSDALFPVDGSELGGNGTAIYSSDGLLHLTGLKDYKGSVFTIYGQPVDAFVIESDSEYKQLYLPSGIYIFSASRGNECVVTKFLAQ